MCPQLDRGLYALLIVEEPDESGDHHRELVLGLDDWLRGTGPNDVLAKVKDEGEAGMGRGRHAHG